MNVHQTELPGVLLIKPDIHNDNRGFFQETWQKEKYKEIGINNKFIQDNHTRSNRNVLRGLHYQIHNMQGQLVFVSNGSIFDVIVDLRRGSPTFGKHITKELSDSNNLQIYMPPGCAHGYFVTSECVDIHYKVTSYYDPNDEAGILWNDESLAINWPEKEVFISDRDKAFPLFSEIPLDNLPGVIFKE